MFVKEADPLIIQDLEARGLLFRAGTYHSHLPVSAGAAIRLSLYYARSTWYIRTSQYKDKGWWS